MERKIADIVSVYKENTDQLPILVAEYTVISIDESKNLRIEVGDTIITIENWSHYFCTRKDKSKLEFSVIDQYV